MDRDSSGPAPLHSTVRRLVARLKRIFGRSLIATESRQGTCHLCGERRDDLDENDLCRPCAMAGW